MDDANADMVMGGSRTSLTIAAAVERGPRFDRKGRVRLIRIRTGVQINANVERPKLLLKQVPICTRFIHGASLNAPHQMGLLDSTGAARPAKFHEDKRANFDPNTQQSISGNGQLMVVLDVDRILEIAPDKLAA
jgi:purine-binding chemotaxis protein CheW